MTNDLNQLTQILDNFVFNIYDSLKDREGVNPAKRDIVFMLSKKIFEIIVTEQKVNMYAAYFAYKLVCDLLKLRFNEINESNVPSQIKNKTLDEIESVVNYLEGLMKSYEK